MSIVDRIKKMPGFERARSVLLIQCVILIGGASGFIVGKYLGIAGLVGMVGTGCCWFAWELRKNTKAEHALLHQMNEALRQMQPQNQPPGNGWTLTDKGWAQPGPGDYTVWGGKPQ